MEDDASGFIGPQLDKPWSLSHFLCVFAGGAGPSGARGAPGGGAARGGAVTGHLTPGQVRAAFTAVRDYLIVLSRAFPLVTSTVFAPLQGRQRARAQAGGVRAGLQSALLWGWLWRWGQVSL